MRRLQTFSLFALFGLATTLAQDNGTGFVSDGYYRIKNKGTNRYIYVTDNKDYYDITHDKEDFQAIQLWKDANKACSDPASVVYIKQVSNGYFDLQAQGTGVYAFTGLYVKVDKKSDGCYEVSATRKGVTKYLSDNETTNDAQGKMGTGGKLNYRKWIVDKIETNHATNYVGIKPTISLNGKFYKPFYVAFPFKAVSPDMHIYIISMAEGDEAYMEEIEGEIPANTPVIIECASADPSQNRIELLSSTSAKVTGNKLSGVYFCNYKRPKESVDAYTKFDAATMRIFSVANGKLVLTDNAPEYLNDMVEWIWDDDSFSYKEVATKCLLPANASYFKADANTPSIIALTTDPTGIANISTDRKNHSAEGVYTISGTQLRPTNDVQGLPAGLYIVGGRKIAVK